jgi:alpha-L-fucosidase
LGGWLKVNGEAIYGTTHWEVFGEGPTRVEVGHISEHKNAPFTPSDIRFTRKSSVLFAIALGWPEGIFVIKSLSSASSIKSEQIERINLLGHEGTLSWRQDEKGLKIEMPGIQPCEYAWCFRIQIKSKK